MPSVAPKQRAPLARPREPIPYPSLFLAIAWSDRREGLQDLLVDFR